MAGSETAHRCVSFFTSPTEVKVRSKAKSVRLIFLSHWTQVFVPKERMYIIQAPQQVLTTGQLHRRQTEAAGQR